MEASILGELIGDLVNKFSNLEWTPNAIIGWALIFGAILFQTGERFFTGALHLQWLGKEALGNGRAEPIRTKVRKYFFPFFTTDPNDEFRPYMHYWTPLALGTSATLLVGFFIAATDSILMIPIGSIVLGVAYFGCVKLLHWQIRKDRW